MGGREGGSSVALYMLDGSTLRAAGQVNGIATLDASGRVPTDQLPSSVYYYQGMWNASTDTPHLADTTPTIGYAWSVSVAGTTTLGAISSWAVGDFAVYGALGWSKIPAGGVLTFNGRLGAVVPVAGDYDGLALNLAAASSFVAPASAAAAPTAAASVAFDTTAKHLKVGDGSSSLTVVDSSSIGVSVQAQSSVLSTLAGNGAPGAFGLARLLDANQAAAQTALGLGTIATQNANNVAITGGSVTGITDLAVADGGTGASTAAGARDNILWASAAAIDPASPYTVAAGVNRVTFASSKTLAPRALSNYADGQTILVTNSSSSTITVTITPADGTIDGSSSVALSVPAHGVVGCQRVSASAWVSLQPSAVGVSRVVLDISGGAWRAAGYGYTSGGWVQVTPFVAPESSGDPEGWGFSLSGTDISLTTGAGVINSVTRTEAPYWGWSLATLGVTLTTPFFCRITDTVTSITLTSPSAADYNGIGLTFGTSSDITTTGQYLHGIGVSNSNYARLSGNTTGVPTAYDVGTTMRTMRYASILPASSGAAPTGYGYTAADAFLAGTTAPAIANGSVPTYLFVELIKLGTPRAGTISAPVITLNF